MLKLRRNIILVPTLLAIVAGSGCGNRTNPATAPPPSTAVTNAAAGPSPGNGSGPGQQEQQARIDQFKQMIQQRAQAKPPANQ